MGQLYDMCQRLMRELEEQNPQPIMRVLATGNVVATTGFVPALVTPEDPDDPAKIARVREAGRDLGLEL